jgi:ribosomal protein S18 acetylase RimI-like enzyme
LTVFIDYPSASNLPRERAADVRTLAIRYKVNAPISAGDLRQIYEAAGLRRPSRDGRRLAQMARHANLTVTAWDGRKLVGIARAVTDFVYCCYLSDLGVALEYQRQGIGREMVRRMHAKLGERVMILLLEAERARGYYAKLGFEKAENAWKLPRKR